VEGVTVQPLAEGELDRLRPLWIALHHRHREVSPFALVADDEQSWSARRALYARRLAAGTAFALTAELVGEAVGYAFCCIDDGPDDTFPVGDQYAEVYSLAVAEGQRGRGIGSLLLDEVDRELERRGIHDLQISVLAGNERAQRLYERRGLQVAELVLYRSGSPARGDIM
jgi:ribosomal protein S18 acetylase RimI-like enzyme